MIKVNLCPVEELESPYWYVPDLAVTLGVALAGYLGVQYYFGTIQTSIDSVNQSIASLDTSTKQLEPDLKRFESLDDDIRRLNDKLGALQSITVSKIERLKPLILLEHLQNLRPTGLWYETLDIGIPTPNSFQIKGHAFDNVLTAEYMMALRSTESQDMDPSDLRTQVFFKNLTLKGTELKKGEVAGFSDLKDVPSFELMGTFADRAPHMVPSTPPPDTAQRVSSRDESPPSLPHGRG